MAFASAAPIEEEGSVEQVDGIPLEEVTAPVRHAPYSMGTGVMVRCDIESRRGRICRGAALRHEHLPKGVDALRSSRSRKDMPMTARGEAARRTRAV